MRHSRLTALLVLALTAALSLVILEGKRLGELAKEYRELRRLSTSLHAGAYVPSVTLAGLGDDSISIGTSGEAIPQVLFLFTTTCPYCKATLPVWIRLYDSLTRANPKLQVTGVSLDSLAQTRS